MFFFKVCWALHLFNVKIFSSSHCSLTSFTEVTFIVLHCEYLYSARCFAFSWNHKILDSKRFMVFFLVYKSLLHYSVRSLSYWGSCVKEVPTHMVFHCYWVCVFYSNYLLCSGVFIGQADGYCPMITPQYLENYLPYLTNLDKTLLLQQFSLFLSVLIDNNFDSCFIFRRPKNISSVTKRL